MFNIKIDTVEEMNILLSGLGKIPLELSLPVWQKVKAQAEAQINAESEEQLQEKG